MQKDAKNCGATRKSGGYSRLVRQTAPDKSDRLVDRVESKAARATQRKRAKKTKEAREERGTFSCRGDMRDFIFLERSHAREVIRCRTYQPEVMSFGSSAESDVLRSIKPGVIVYDSINQKR